MPRRRGLYVGTQLSNCNPGCVTPEIKTRLEAAACRQFASSRRLSRTRQSFLQPSSIFDSPSRVCPGMGQVRHRPVLRSWWGTLPVEARDDGEADTRWGIQSCAAKFVARLDGNSGDRVVRGSQRDATCHQPRTIGCSRLDTFVKDTALARGAATGRAGRVCREMSATEPCEANIRPS